MFGAHICILRLAICKISSPNGRSV